jgi:mono/diheme cytochrome c family protein
LAYVKFALPDVGPPEEIVIEITPERVERGEYLANHVWLCMDCHSERDWNTFSAPPIAGTEGSGGDEFTQEMGFPGHYYATNITPGGIGDWTDGEILRAITTGVSKDGRALFPIMPYLYLGKADKEDVYSVIAYIRTLDPVEKTYPKAESDFPFNFIINLIPTKANFQPAPNPSDKVAYGKYLAWSCIECHTVAEKGQIILEQAYGGGFKFPLETGGTVYSPNITPDMETGIGKWTEEQFIRRFKQYQDSGFVLSSVGENEFQTYMPWQMFSGMTESDLSALYAYLRTVKPISNKVEKFVAD